MNRRAFLGGLAATAFTGVTGFALARRSGASEPLRLGAMANLTHAPMLAGIGSGRIAAALMPYAVELSLFRAGPRVAEALVGGAIDAGTAGPAAIVIHHARHGGLRVISGCASGGASLVVTPTSGIAKATDARGKRLAVTQLGTTQDVALRRWLSNADLRDRATGGDVAILAISGATILDQLTRGSLDGAWLPEPWATRACVDAGAVRLLDERDLWPNRRFATAVLAGVAKDDGAEWVTRLRHALDTEVTRALVDPLTCLREAHAELTRRMGNPGKLRLFEAAAAFVDFTSDPIRSSIDDFGDAAARLGFCGPEPSAHLFRDS